MAAIVDGDPPDIVLNREIVEEYGLDDSELRGSDRPRTPNSSDACLCERSSVAVDDRQDRSHHRRRRGDGNTMKVAIRSPASLPCEIVVALPVAPPDAGGSGGREADRIVCLSQPARFFALGHHYHNFPQLSDEEVVGTLRNHAISPKMSKSPADC